MEARSLVRAGLTPAEAADLTGCHIEAAQTKGAGLGWIPTPDQIQQRAAKVRAKWTPAELERRRVGPRQEIWTAPDYQGKL
jgi:hypothetical protein